MPMFAMRTVPSIPEEVTMSFGWLASFVGADGISFVQTTKDPDHIVVLQHGLHAYPGQFDQLMTHLVAKHTKETLLFICPNQSKKLFQTHQSIAVAGYDIALIIQTKVAFIESKFGRRPRRISFIGHSLGGLYLRAAIGCLEEVSWFEKNKENIIPTLFMTCASPHLGTRPLLNLAGLQGGSTITTVLRMISQHDIALTAPLCAIIRASITTGFDQAGRQMMLEDEDGLLEHMADPNLQYIAGLKRFNKHVLMINCADDIQVPFYTASITLGVPQHLHSLQQLNENVSVESIVCSADIPLQNLSSNSDTSPVETALQNALNLDDYEYVDHIITSAATDVGPQLVSLSTTIASTNSGQLRQQHPVVANYWPTSPTDTQWQTAMAMEGDKGIKVQRMCQNLSEAVVWERRFFWFANIASHVQIITDPAALDAVADFFLAVTREN